MVRFFVAFFGLVGILPLRFCGLCSEWLLVLGGVMSDRNADYEWRDSVLEKWSTDPDQSPFGCGNLNSHLVWIDGKSQWLPLQELVSRSWKSYQSMSRIVTSPDLLYRLACTFPATIELSGPVGYKCVWAVGVIHKSGVRICFGEHKGAAAFWSDFSSLDDPRFPVPSPEFLADLKDLVDYLVSDVCAHPYDGLVAGCIA